MAEYIERGFALDVVKRTSGDYAAAFAEIAHAPAADVVPVVRCRECIYRDGTPGQPNILCGQMHDDDFCSYGQRKEDAHVRDN